MDHTFNDKELDALNEIDAFAGFLFFKMKSQMDFKSRTIGKVGKKISLLSLRKDMYRKPVAGIKKTDTGLPSIQNIRTAINRLIEAGVLERIEGEKTGNFKEKKEGLTTLVFYFPLASLKLFAHLQGNTEGQHKNSGSSSLEPFSQQEARADEIRGLQGNEDESIVEIYDEYCVSHLTHEANTYQGFCGNSNISESINLNSNTINHNSNLNIVDSINIAHFSKKNARFFTEEKFDQFWNLYPKKYRKDKKRALTAFIKNIKNEKIFLELLDGIRKRIEYEELCDSAGISTQFWPNPPAYLNKERWNDQFDFSEVSNEINRRNTQTATGRVKNAFDNLRKVRGALYRRIDESK